MNSSIPPQARTTPKILQKIKDSGLSSREAAKVFNITRATAQKWLGRDDVQDRSHRDVTLRTTLNQAQEAIVLALRHSLYLPLDDLLFITKQYINPAVSRACIARLLKREGVSHLMDLIATAEHEERRANSLPSRAYEAMREQNRQDPADKPTHLGSYCHRCRTGT